MPGIRISAPILGAMALLAAGGAMAAPDHPGAASATHAAVGLSAGTLQLVGRGSRFGVDYRSTLRCAPDGRFHEEQTGGITNSEAFDGRAGWRTDWSGRPEPLEGVELELARITRVVLSDRWREPVIGVVVTRDSTNPGGYWLATPDGRLRLRLDVDPVTKHPRRLTWASHLEVLVWDYSDFRRVGDRNIPGRIVHRAGAMPPFHWELESASIAPVELTDVAPPPPPDDVRFDLHISPRLELRKAPTGHLFVRPRLNGRELGWFFVDSGAAESVLSARAADALGLAALGSVGVASVEKTEPGRIWRADSLTLGPVTLRSPWFVEFDLAPFEAAFQFPVDGIIGHNLFARVLVEFEPGGSALRLHDPAAWTGAAEFVWYPLTLHQNIPCIQTRFEGERKAMFRLDYGAAGGSFANVLFHSPATAEPGFMDGRKTTPLAIPGLDAVEGQLRWFELGGRRFEELPVAFSRDTRGPQADPWIAGNIGAGLLHRFRVVLDLPGRRAGFRCEE